MNRVLVLFAVVLSFAAVRTGFCEEGEEKVFTKGIFSFRYPSKGWSIETLPPPKGKNTTNVRMIADGKPQLSVILTWDGEAKAAASATELPHSAVLADAFGKPIALSLAQNKPENIVTSIGIINIADVTQLNTRFVVVQPDDTATTTVDAFAFISDDLPGNTIVGAIVSESNQNQNALPDAFYDRLYEAYGIVQSFALTKKK